MSATIHEEIVVGGQPAAYNTFRLDMSHQPPTRGNSPDRASTLGDARPVDRTGVFMDHFVVESPGVLLAVRQSRDDGEPLLLLHGGPGVPDSMQTTIAPLLH